MDFAYIILILLLLIVCIALVRASLALRGTTARAWQAFTERAEAIGRAVELTASVEQSRAYLDALGETTSDGVLLLDTNRRIVWGTRLPGKCSRRAMRRWASPLSVWSAIPS